MQNWWWTQFGGGQDAWRRGERGSAVFLPSSLWWKQLSGRWWHSPAGLSLWVIVSYSVFYRPVISVPSSLSKGCVREVLCRCHSSVTAIRHCDRGILQTKHLSSNLSWLQRVIGHDRYGGEHVSRKAGRMLKQLLKVHILIYKHERERQKELIGSGIGFWSLRTHP